jgi:hypothetical protein
MKRLFASIAGGILIPVIYTFVVGTVTDIVFAPDGDTIYWNGKPMPGLTFAPTLFPMYLIEFALQYGPTSAIFVLLNPWFRLTFTVLFDFFLYAFLTYAALRKLGWLSKRQKDTTARGLAGGS